MEQGKLVLDVGGGSSTGELENVLFGASVVLSSSESVEPRKVENVKGLVGESGGFSL